MIHKKYNYSLYSHNTFGIDAYCKTFIEYDEAEDLVSITDIIQDANENFLHIGEGSNLLFTKDYSGIILHSLIKGISISPTEHADEYLVKVGAGVKWDDFVAQMIDNGLYGLENLSSIPGEVGAASVQNIGAYGVEVADLIECVEVFEWETKKIHIIPVSDCHYAYRKSRFKTSDINRYVITYVTFKLHRKFQPCLSYRGLQSYLENENIRIDELTAIKIREIIQNIRQEKLPDPKDIGNAGSFFMNPVISETQFHQLLRKNPNIPHYKVENGFKIPAAWLIEQCGWKGKREGNCGVYERQALVIVNYKNASGQEIVHLSENIMNDVYNKFNIQIHPEVNFI